MPPRSSSKARKRTKARSRSRKARSIASGWQAATSYVRRLQGRRYAEEAC